MLHKLIVILHFRQTEPMIKTDEGIFQRTLDRQRSEKLCKRKYSYSSNYETSFQSNICISKFKFTQNVS